MTELHAFRPLTTAFEKTKKLLLEPFDAMLWVKLVIITFFVGSSGVSSPGNTLQYVLNQSDLERIRYYDFSQILSDTTLMLIILLVVLAIVAVALIFSYLRGVFSFVLVEALTTGNVEIVRPFKENMGRGFKAFLFNVAASVISLAVIGGLIAAMVLAILWAIGTRDASSLSTPGVLGIILVVVIGLVFMIGFSIIIGLIVGFFYDFCVPLIYFRGMGLRQAIGSVYRLVCREPLEFLVYVITRWVLEIAVSLVLGIIILFLFAVCFAIGVILVFAAFAAAKVSILLAIPFALIFVIGLLLMIVASAVIALPINVYFRYYSLDFLQSLDPAAVRYTGRFA